MAKLKSEQKRTLLDKLTSVFAPRIVVSIRRLRKVRKGNLGGSTKRYKLHKEAARKFVHWRLAHFNQHYNFAYYKVAIRNQRSRWGSCSRKGNLNFNYRLVDIPAHLADAVIVHELCHLKEMNHSKAFWELVAETIPDHKERRRDLAKIDLRAKNKIPDDLVHVMSRRRLDMT